MISFFDVEQNTDEWFTLRAGHLTGSKASTIMANYGKAFGEPAKKLAVNIAIEQMTGKPINDGFSNDHTERGHAQEIEAREIYSLETFTTVKNGGFFSDGELGCSPDGLIGSDGIIEIKSVMPHVHYATIKRGTFPPEYKWQLIWNMLFSGKNRLDFISYCALFPEDRKIFIHRIDIKNFGEEVEQIRERTREFLSLVQETKEVIFNSDYTIEEI